MKGMFYYEDKQEITFMWLFKDGRVLFLGKSKKQQQFVYEIFTQESGELNFASGKFIMISENQIRMLVNDEFGKVIVKAEVMDESTIRLELRSRDTNFIYKKEFRRYVENQPINICYKELSSYWFN